MFVVLCRYCCKALKSVSIGQNVPDKHEPEQQLTFASIEKVVTSCFSLERLVVLRIPVTEAQLEVMSSYCQQIRVLHFRKMVRCSFFESLVSFHVTIAFVCIYI